MSIFSDYRVGAMSDIEFHNAGVRMNAEDLQLDFDYDDYEEDNDADDRRLPEHCNPDPSASDSNTHDLG